MKFIDSNQVRTSINKAASQRIPFFFAINYEMTEGLFIENPMEQSEVLFQFNNIGNKPLTAARNQEAELTVFPISKLEYGSKFKLVQKGLENSEIDVVNLTVQTPINTNIDCHEIFLRSQSPYQIYISGKFVCFSPERFIKIEKGKISSYPMKGTIDASVLNAEQVILSDSKEIAEHTTTVQLISEELSSVARDVAIKRFRYIGRIESNKRTLLQVSSEIEGELPDNYATRMGDILFSLLPAVSITGSPKANAQKHISLAEDQPRGYYCGIAGYFDGETLDTTVLIRLIETNSGDKFFRSGGGVTRESICEKEYQEVLNKIYLPFV
ncbi:MAG: aminodeoxychorismate synthase component I [Candidatus Saccharimonadaceae bacterium]